MNQRPYATMVTNFDSTEQKRSWERLLQEAQSQEDEQSSAQNISSATLHLSKSYGSRTAIHEPVKAYSTPTLRSPRISPA